MFSLDILSHRMSKMLFATVICLNQDSPAIIRPMAVRQFRKTVGFGIAFILLSIFATLKTHKAAQQMNLVADIFAPRPCGTTARHAVISRNSPAMLVHAAKLIAGRSRSVWPPPWGTISPLLSGPGEPQPR